MPVENEATFSPHPQENQTMKDSCSQGDWINKGASVRNTGICPDTAFLSAFQAGGGDRAICPIVLLSVVNH